MQATQTAHPPMPVIVGAPRSGTTLLRLMLDAHPRLAIPPETGFLALGDGLERADGSDEAKRRTLFATLTGFPADAPAWPDFGIDVEELRAALDAIVPFSLADGYRAFYRLYAARFDKPRWGDKTPLYCQHMAGIARVLPEAHFIHLIRDGRAVALSLRETWFAPSRDLATLAGYWRDCVTAARSQAAQCPHYLEVRFEDLVHDHEGVLRRVCAFLALDFDAAMLTHQARAPERLAEHRARIATDGRVIVSRDDRLRQQALTMQPPQASRADAWLDMSDEDQRKFEHVAGPLMRELGYVRLHA